jgi:hypothetical protein
LLSELSKQPQEKEYVMATFKGSRLINGQSVETRRKGELEFIFAHIFGLISEGPHTLWGLDQSVTRLGMEYGNTDRVGMGIGRTSVDKTFDGYVRYKALRQSSVSPLYRYGNGVSLLPHHTAKWRGTRSTVGNRPAGVCHATAGGT